MTIMVGATGFDATGAFVSSYTTVSFGTTQATGSTFVVLITAGSNTSVTDSHGNTYTHAGSIAFNLGGNTLDLWYCINGTGGSNTKITVSTSGSYYLTPIGFCEFENVGGGTFDSNPAGTSAYVATSLAAPSITTTVANELVVNAFATANENTQTITDSGGIWAIAASQSSSSYGNAAFTWAVPSSTSAVNDTISLTTADSIGALAVSIKPASGGASAQIPAPIDPTITPRRAPQIDTYRNIAALIAVSSVLSYPFAEPTFYKRAAPQIDLFPNIAAAATQQSAVIIGAPIDPPSWKSRASIDIFPNIAALSTPPAYVPPPAIDPQVKKGAAPQVDLPPNIAVQFQTIRPAGTLIDPTLWHQRLQVDIYPNIAAGVAPPTVLINEPIDPWINKRYPPQIDIYPNIASLTYVAPSPEIPAPVEPVMWKPRFQYDIYPNVALLVQPPAYVPRAPIEISGTRRPTAQPDIYPNIAVNLQTAKPAGTYVEPVTWKPRYQQDQFPNVAALAHPPVYVPPPPIDPTITKRKQLFFDLYQNVAAFTYVVPQFHVNVPVDPAIRKTPWARIDQYPNIAVSYKPTPPPPPTPGPPIPTTPFCCGADYDLCIDQSATYTRVVTWLLVTNDVQVPVNLVGCTAAMQIRPYALSTTVLYDASADITLGGVAGTITLTIPSAATEDFTWWSGVYDLLITDAYGNVTRLLSGKVTVCQGVTVPGHGIQIVTDSGVWLATDSGILIYTS